MSATPLYLKCMVEQVACQVVCRVVCRVVCQGAWEVICQGLGQVVKVMAQPSRRLTKCVLMYLVPFVIRGKVCSEPLYHASFGMIEASAYVVQYV